MIGFIEKMIYILLSILLVSCSSHIDTTIEPTTPLVPRLISTTPVNGAEDLEFESLQFTLNFDSEIDATSPFELTLNDVKTSVDVNLHGKSLEFNLEGLLDNNIYQLNIARGQISAVGNKEVKVNEISLKFKTKEIPHNPNNPLAVNEPTKEALFVYNFLKESMEDNILSCAMSNVSWNINEAEWVKLHTGKYPAMIGLDYIHLHETYEDYTNISIVEDWWARNGLITICWHWNVPIASGSTKYAFYTYSSSKRPDGTIFDISKISNIDSYEYKYMVADIEKVADRLLLIKDKNIPILWRPMHEASGGWFWWGAKGAEPYKEAWKLMFNIFKSKGLNNIIWVWTSETSDESWYPGDEYVDIVSRDKYKTSASDLNTDYDSLQNIYPNKLITLSEFGEITNDTELFENGKWLWFMPWYDYNRTKDVNSTAFKNSEHIYISTYFWTKAFENPRVVSLDEMPSLKNSY